MPDNLYQGDIPTRTKEAAIAYRAIAQSRQQKLLTQLAINFVHLEDITGATTADFLADHQDEMEQKALELVINDKETVQADLEEDGEKRYEMHQETIAQCLINQPHILMKILNKIDGVNISDCSSPSTISEKKAQELHRAIIEEKNRKPELRQEIEADVKELKSQNEVLKRLISDQVEFTLANIPRGKKLDDDQQNALYLGSGPINRIP